MHNKHSVFSILISLSFTETHSISCSETTPSIRVLFSPSASLLSLSASWGNHLSWAGCFIGAPVRSSSPRPKFKFAVSPAAPATRRPAIPYCTLFYFTAKILRHEHRVSAVPSIKPSLFCWTCVWSSIILSHPASAPYTYLINLVLCRKIASL